MRVFERPHVCVGHKRCPYPGCPNSCGGSYLYFARRTPVCVSMKPPDPWAPIGSDVRLVRECFTAWEADADFIVAEYRWREG